MEITEKWLGEIAGWAAMKAARSLVAGGQIEVIRVEKGLIQGLSGTGRRQYRAGLKIRGRSDIDNLCTCPTSRRTGAMCEHSIAVGLASLKPNPSTKRQEKSYQKNVNKDTTASYTKPKSDVTPIQGRLSIYLPDQVRTGTLKSASAVFLKFERTPEPETLALSSWMAEQGIPPQSAPLSLPGPLWTQFLSSLGGHPRVFVGKPSNPAPVHVSESPMLLPVSIEATNTDQVRFERQDHDWNAITGPDADASWWYCAPTKALFRLPSPGSTEAAVLLAELVANRQTERPLRWWLQHRDNVVDSLQIEPKGRQMANFHLSPVPCQFTIEIDGSLQAAVVSVRVSYGALDWALAGKPPVDSSNESVFPIKDEFSESIFYVRNEDAERRLMNTLESFDFQLDASGNWRLNGQNRVLHFFGTGIPHLSNLGTIQYSQRWRSASRGLERVAPLVSEGSNHNSREEDSQASGSDWMSMEFRYEATDGFRLQRSEILRMVRSGQASVQGRQGKRYVIDSSAVESFEESLKDVPLELTPDGARVHAWHAHTLLGESAAPNDRNFKTAKPLNEDELNGKLGDLAKIARPYQLTGIRWMEAQTRAGQGGILADDMGLGKTLQSIALIRAINDSSSTTKATLIVCPKSLLGNWKAELERFAPELTIGVSHGPERKKLQKTNTPVSVLLTTYSLISRDLDWLSSRKYDLVILDEASYIRNPDTAAAKALQEVPAKARFALTGTPIENTVRDLWSILHFALPGYLGDRNHFKERFEQPLSNGPHTEEGKSASKRLQRLIQPFFLRRTKSEVLKELPEKIEQVLWCDPSPAQAELYSRLLDEGRDEIKAARKHSGAGGAKMTMFTVLLRLRQVCCDLRLTGIPKDTTSDLATDELCAKWPLVEDRLNEIIRSDGKLLIFSQFTTFLQLIRNNLDNLNISYSYLDGSTSNRQAEVDAFQNEPERRVFLISLKAGGYGLNLTAADHVFLMDPWWNPAVESQAIDRAHRMGQTKVVSAYRMAIRGTVEERILKLQEKKRGLVEAAISEDGTWSGGATAEELAEILEV